MHVQILDEADHIAYSGNALGEGISPTIHPLTMGK